MDLFIPEAKRAQFEAYLPPLTRQADFDAFWQETLTVSQEVPLSLKMEPISHPLRGAAVYDVRYAGFDGLPIRGWFLSPAFSSAEKTPVIIDYHGYGLSRGVPSQYAAWVLSGYSVLAVDCREQGGETGAQNTMSGGGAWAARGLQDPKTYYYRYVYMDCLRAVDVAQACPGVDPARMILHGRSQGGGIAMMVAALDGRPCCLLCDVPSNSNIERRVLERTGSFSAVAEYLALRPHMTAEVYRTLSYFDTMNCAHRIACPVFASVAMLDETAPAICYYASFNRIVAPKQITVYPLNNHDGASVLHMEKKLRFLAQECV